ncbi:MAG TPA: hypothetical protein PKV66_01515 [Candidatus Pelethenecus sp.]|nr:hypothetical protein [Candidatus Pelethenecus sp.]
MGLYYESQDSFPVIGTKSGTTRTSVALTTAYDVANKTKIIEVGGYSKANFDILYTMGATETSNSIEVRFQASNDGTNFYRIPNESASGGTSTLTAREFTFVGTNAAAATISIGLDVFYKYLEISVKESGVVTNAGTVFVDCTLSGK